MIVRTLTIAVVLGALACAPRAQPPTAEDAKPRAPDLTGRSVMVLPAQPAPAARRDRITGEVIAGFDAELAYWLAERAPRVHWSFAPELRRALERNAMLNIDVDALAVGSFHRAQVRNIGDPLLGDLRRLGAVIDARLALVPVAINYIERADGGRGEAALALIDTYGGRVLWYGVLAGEPGAAGETETAASLARAVAHALVP
jgi:hypothetical protein